VHYFAILKHMHIGSFAMLYVISLVLFLALDMLWLGVVAKNFYARELGSLLGEVVWPAAFIFYALFIAGLTYFVIYPALEENSLRMALLSGAFFGLVAYATYDLTNMATLKGWSLQLSIVDMLWGAFLGGVVSVCAILIYRLFA